MSGTAEKDGRRANVLGSASALSEQAKVIALYSLKWAQGQGAEYHIRSISIYPPSRDRNGQWLIVAKAWYGGYKLVGFHRGTDMLTALAGFFTRWWQGKVDWKKDAYAEKD